LWWYKEDGEDILSKLVHSRDPTMGKYYQDMTNNKKYLDIMSRWMV
jgi:hypothetical protein